MAAARHFGRGSKIEAVKAAVDAMRFLLNEIDLDGTIIIGEGEKDQAPMLYNGEKVGTGELPVLDMAVDPVEGTELVAKGMPNAIATIAAAPPGTMFNPGPMFYMSKIAVGHEARDVIDIYAPVKDNLNKIAHAKGMDIDELTVVILDRPRHKRLIHARLWRSDPFDSRRRCSRCPDDCLAGNWNRRPDGHWRNARGCAGCLWLKRDAGHDAGHSLAAQC